MTADDWAIKAHETIHASEVCAQNYSAFDGGGNTLGVQVQESVRKGQIDSQATKDFDLKQAYGDFLETGVDAYIYFGKVIAGFTIKELADFGKADKSMPDTEWKVRESIERGRSEWGNTLRRVGIRAKWS